MMNKTSPTRRYGLILGVALYVFSAGLAADELSLSQTPLFLTIDVKPNLVLAIDDSGSMDSEVLMPTNDGALWWKGHDKSSPLVCPRGFVGCNSFDQAAAGAINFNLRGKAEDDYNGNDPGEDDDDGDGPPSDIWKKFVYLFPNGTGSSSGRRVYSDSNNDHYAIPPVPAYAWARSHEYNAAYFNPAVSYDPWPGYGAVTFPNSTPTAAKTDPVLGSETFDLTKDRANSSSVDTTVNCNSTGAGTSGNHRFKLYDGMVLHKDVCWRNPATGNWEKVSNTFTVSGVFVPNDGGGTSSNVNGTDAPIRYFPATFFVSDLTALPVDYGFNINPDPRIKEGYAPDGSPLYGVEIKQSNFQAAGGYSATENYNRAIQNFANWFTYYRKRHLATRAGIGESFAELDHMRVGHFFINDRDDVKMRDIDIDAERNAFFSSIYGRVGSGGTPNRQSLDHCGEQFERDSTSPDSDPHDDDDDTPIIQFSCQQNFGILFTDGYATTDTGSGVGNADGDNGSPYADTYSNTIADIAMHYYEDLDWSGIIGADVDGDGTGDPIVGGKVPTPNDCDNPTPLPISDCNDDPHMVTFGVTLGQEGRIYGVNAAATADPYANPPVWQDVNATRDPSQVDDLWHATINGRGELLNAKTPREIANEFTAVLDEIIRRTSSASSVALNSGFLREGTSVYLASFNSGDWTGELQALPISTGDGSNTCNSEPEGTICSAEWSASSGLPAWSSREIITFDPTTKSGIPFRYANITAGQKAKLGVDVATQTNVLEFLRGNSALEGISMRDRVTPLGDTIHSDPFYVAIPPFAYSFDGYATFRYNHRNRKPMVYIGANDGMLHGFDAETGIEQIAYVPDSVYHNLAQLADPAYGHLYYVDGSPSVGDVQINASDATDWSTILVGGLRAGGQGYFALDITQPGTKQSPDAAYPNVTDLFSEGNASSIALWEFTDADDPDLGFSFSQPSIARVNVGGSPKWAVIFGSGYNNHVADGSAGDGEAHLFILMASGPGVDDVWDLGTDYYKLSTGNGSVADPNGLATPAPVDNDQDAVVDFVYAGDQNGNLWRFDLNVSPWVIGNSGNPVFTTDSPAGGVDPQPITVRPEVGRKKGTVDELVVYFGTGKYLEQGDNDPTGTPTQTFYAVWDKMDGLATNRGNMLQQQITAEVTEDGDPCGISGSCFRITTDNTFDPTTHRGWYMDMVNTEGGNTDPFGERITTDPLLRQGRIIFSTLIPSKDPCDFGGSGWLMELDAEGGGRLAQSPFDLNDDKQFNSSDKIGMDTDNDGTDDESATVGGFRSAIGIMATPTILGVAEKEYEFKILSGSAGTASLLESTGGEYGRLTWRELRRE